MIVWRNNFIRTDYFASTKKSKELSSSRLFNSHIGIFFARHLKTSIPKQQHLNPEGLADVVNMSLMSTHDWTRIITAMIRFKLRDHKVHCYSIIGGVHVSHITILCHVNSAQYNDMRQRHYLLIQRMDLLLCYHDHKKSTLCHKRAEGMHNTRRVGYLCGRKYWLKWLVSKLIVFPIILH